jgi:uncharacterized hydantoinase/oxoprolinase family protein
VNAEVALNRQLRRLVAEHTELDETAAALEDLVRGAQPRRVAVSAMAEFAVAFQMHLQGEHGLLEQVASECEARKLGVELDALRSDWADYLSCWSELSACQDWELYAEHTTAMLQRVRRRIARENVLIEGVGGDCA